MKEFEKRDPASASLEHTPESGDAAPSRREFIATTGKISGAIAARVVLGNLGGASDAAASEARAEAGALPELVRLDALQLSKLIKLKQVACREVMATYLDHIARINPKVNAIVSLQERDGLMKQAAERDAQLARGEYLGWMHGFPHAVKDLEPTKGIRTTWGSPLLDMVPDHDAIFVERLKKNGAIIIGKTNAPEFGFGSQTYNTVFGTTLNAYDQSKVAGGSSGGACVSLALRMLPVADGSDMMGSLRNPAAFNNVIGFRPSFGRVPDGPSEELYCGQLSCGGPLGRSVADVAMLLSVMAGHDARDPLSLDQDPAVFSQPLERNYKGTRLGWLGNFNGYLQMEPGVMELCRGSFKAFESIGCTVEDARPDFPPEKLWDAWIKLRHWLSASGVQELYNDPAKRAKLKPEVQWEIQGGLNLTGLEVHAASLARSDWYRSLGKLFERYDYLLLPSAQVFPFDANVHWPKTINGVAMDTYHRWMEVVIPGSMSGGPILNVPVGFSAGGLPMGMQIIGRHLADFAVLQLGHAYERATHWVRDHLPTMLKQ
jgi:amidase